MPLWTAGRRSAAWVRRQPRDQSTDLSVVAFARMSAAQTIAAVIAAFVVTQAAIFATTIYLHRGLTHRALSVHPALAYPSRVLIWLTTGMRPREWVAVHRKHHAATDTAEDPHSPKVLGFWRRPLRH